MKWKIRVVSIILCTAMLIGLLPAEQVFADEVMKPFASLSILGFTNQARGVSFSFGKDGDSTEGIYFGPSAPNGKLTSTTIEFQVKKDADSTELVLADVSGRFDITNMNRSWYSPGMWDYASAFYCIRKGPAFTLQNNMSTDRCSNVQLAEKVLTNSDWEKLLAYLRQDLKFKEGDTNIYMTEAYWIDTNVRSNNTSDWFSHTDRSWYYQRITCDYNVENDLFIYTYVHVLQDEGDDNVYTIAQYESKDIIEFALIPFEYEVNDSYLDSLKWVHDWISYYVTEFFNTSDYMSNLEKTLGRIYDANVRLSNAGLDIENPAVTINDTLGINADGEAVGAPWVQSTCLSYFIGLFEATPELLPLLSETTFGRNFYSSCSPYSDPTDTSDYKLGYKPSIHYVSTFEIDDQWNVTQVVHLKFAEYVKDGTLTSSVFTKYTLLGDSEVIQGESSPHNLSDSVELCSDTVNNSDLVWQTTTTVYVGEKKGGWRSVITHAFSMYKAITLDKVNFIPASTFLELKNESHRAEMSKSPFYYAHFKMEDILIDLEYKSNTGVNIALGLEGITKDGKLLISYMPNNSVESTLNWKTILSKELNDRQLNINTANDLVYCLSYMQYLCNNESYNFNLNTIEIDAGSGNKYILLCSDTAKDSFLLTKGRFWIDDKDYGANIPGGNGWTYVDTLESAMNRLGNTGLVSIGTDSKLLKYNNAVYNRLTGERLFDLGCMPVSNVNAHKDVGVYSIFGYDEESVDATRMRIDSVMGTEMFTGHVLGVLSDAQYMYIYATQYALGQIGATSLTGIDSYNKWEYFINNPHSRAEKLEGTKYASAEDSGIDYLPRLPILDVEFPSTVYTLLYNVEYAAAVCDWSTLSDETGIDIATMESFLYATSTENIASTATVMKNKIRAAYDRHKTTNLTVDDWAEAGVYDNMNDDYMAILRAVVNIHNLCDLLYSAEYSYKNGGTLPESISGKGEDIAKRWSPVIYGYYRIYEDDRELFEALSKNLVRFIAEDFSYSTPIEPLGFVIKFEDEQLSAQWKYGYALSSMYVPFQTNVYEVAAIEEKADDAEWVTNFYYKYGFYRKALYITTDPDAVVNRYTAGIQSGTKVATLRDLLNYNRDIELYVDQGFYNGDLLEEQLDRFIQNTNEGSVFGSIYDACNLTPDAILKDGGYATYSSAIQAKVRPFGYEIAEAEKEEAAKMFAYEDFILSEDEILGEDGMLSAYEYSIQQPYGLVSAMYRSGTLFNKANQASVQNEPVFVSSKNANAIGSYNKDLYRSFYNYLMLSAMEETIERETTLLVDLDAPIFIDIFGNILTSDGYVIIPAAANPTLVGEDWVPYTLGFATYVNNADPSVFKNMTYEFYDFLYGINYAAAIGKSDIDTYSPNFRDNQKKIGGGYFFLRQNGTSTLGTTNLTDGVASTTVNWDNPNTHVAALKNLLFSVHYLNTADMYSMTTVNMILEVLRGAPIEFIDFANEGITTTHALTKGGATVAYMSEQLLNSVQTDSNGTERNAKFSATLNVLDLFHIESAEKVALLAVKLLLIGFLILLAVQIIADASVGKMPVKTVGRIIVTCVLTGTCISLLPVLTEFSLSKLTQMFLQPEAAELLAMQAQRDSYGIEIGITESYNTESSTDIIVKVGELDVQWYDLLLYSVYSSIDDSFTDLYTKAADGLPLAEASYTFTSGKNIYMDLGKIMDSTVVQYNGELGLITNERTREMSDDDMSASYLFPYYVFLDQLVANVNLYNKTNGVQPLSYNINSDGSIRTQDMTYAYFHSTEFMTTDYDILDLYRILNINTYKLSYCPYFSDDDLVTMGGSLWYPTNTDTDTLTASVELLYQSARDYVANNSSMLSYVSDGAFLKSLAMYLAVEYNSIFGVGTADAFELKCVDTKDMLRYVVSHPKDVYKYATRSFSRYAFEVGDVWGAILATALYVIMCVTNAIKVVAYVLTYVTAVWSIIYHRVFKRESDYSVYGFFILIGEITILNVIYSASLKVMMNLTRWGMPGLAALGVSILLQGGIIIGFLLLCFNGVKNVKNLGQKEIHRIQTIINNLNRDRSSNTNDNPNQPERTVAVLQAHDFSRRELDNYNGDRANVADLLAHDRRREMGQIGQEATES